MREMITNQSYDLLTLNLDRFVDRDMFMRYHLGLGIGHTYIPRPTSRPTLSLVRNSRDQTIMNDGLLGGREPEEEADGNSDEGGDLVALETEGMDESGETSEDESDDSDHHLLALQEMYGL